MYSSYICLIWVEVIVELLAPIICYVYIYIIVLYTYSINIKINSLFVMEFWNINHCNQPFQLIHNSLAANSKNIWNDRILIGNCIVLYVYSLSFGHYKDQCYKNSYRVNIEKCDSDSHVTYILHSLVFLVWNHYWCSTWAPVVSVTVAVAVVAVAVVALHVPSCGISPVYFETIPENK